MPLKACVDEARNERMVVMREGKPVALIIGVEGADAEQLERESSAEFWKLIAQRRAQPTLTRAELEHNLAQPE